MKSDARVAIERRQKEASESRAVKAFLKKLEVGEWTVEDGEVPTRADLGDPYFLLALVDIALVREAMKIPVGRKIAADVELRGWLVDEDVVGAHYWLVFVRGEQAYKAVLDGEPVGLCDRLSPERMKV